MSGVDTQDIIMRKSHSVLKDMWSLRAYNGGNQSRQEVGKAFLDSEVRAEI